MKLKLEILLFLNEETGKIEPAKIKGLPDKGVQPVFKLTTESGRSIRTTGNHPYLTHQGWQKVTQLKIGDEIAVSNLFLFSREAVDDISQSNGNTHYSSRNIEEKHTLSKCVHSYFENDNAKYKKNKDNIIPRKVPATFIKDIPPTNTFTKALNNKPLATSLQKLDTTFNWLGLENNSINSDDSNLKNSVKSDIQWDKIVSIKYVGKKQVYDIEVEPAKIKGLLDKGVQPVFKLTTESGRSIRTTGNHPYLTPQGWQKVGQLNVSDEIAVPKAGK